MSSETNRKIRDYLLANPMEGSIILRRDFELFIDLFHYEITKENFIFKPFHLNIIKALENLVYNDRESSKKNLVISIPPRWGKSALVKYAIAWFYCINKNCNNIYTSYSDILVLKFSEEIRRIVESDLYRKLFGLSLELDAKSKRRWKIKDGGEMYASSMGGTITGMGAGLTDGNEFGGALVIDDPLKAIDFKSTIERQNCIDYYNETLKTRLNNMEKTPIILIMQRLHQEDLVGYIEKNEIDEWNIIEVKALDEETNIAAWPEKMSSERLLRIRETNPFTYYSQYQQSPIQLGGSLIRTEWFKRYREPKERYRQMYIVCDTAFSTKQSADNSAFMLVGITEENDMYLLDLYVNKMDFIDLKNTLLNFFRKAQERYRMYNSISDIFIENKASGMSLIQELRHERLPVSELYPTHYSRELKKEQTTDKYTRYLEVSSDIANGYVYIPEQSDWVLDFLAECESFDGLGTYRDDRIDCLIYALKIRRQRQEIDWDKSLEVLLENS